MNKKLLYLILVITIVIIILFSCSGNNESYLNSHDISQDDKSPITFKVFIAETDSNPDKFASPVAKEIQKKQV